MKLSASSAEGKVVILRIVEAGELIGLPATLSSKPYEATAETTEPTETNFFRQDAFLNFLREHGDAALSAAKLLTNIYFTAYDEVRTLRLSRTANQKMARFILDWSTLHSSGRDRLRMAFTHEEIAEFLGATRETVSRTLNGFKAKGLISVVGSTLEIRNRAALEKLAGI